MREQGTTLAPLRNRSWPQREANRRYGIAVRVPFRWKQELAPPAFFIVQVTDAAASSGAGLAIWGGDQDAASFRREGAPGSGLGGHGRASTAIPCWFRACSRPSLLPDPCRKQAVVVAGESVPMLNALAQVTRTWDKEKK